MIGIWWVLHLADFMSHELMTSQMATVILNVSLLSTVLNTSRCCFQLLGTAKCLAGTFLVLYVPLLCPVLRGIVTVSTTNCIALDAKFACE